MVVADESKSGNSRSPSRGIFVDRGNRFSLQSATDRPQMIVSVHIPKTAGSSFKDLLIQYLGEQVCLRYGQTPLRYRAEGDSIPPLDLGAAASACAVVHGHFVADRVNLPIDAKPAYAVWLRHPVERLISHYFFWKRQPYLDQPLCRRLIEEEMDIETFSALDAMRDLQSFFLGAIPLSHFDFVGVTEHFEESIERFNATFGTDLHPAMTVNANRDKPDSGYRSMIGAQAYDAIAAQNSQDMALYAQALSAFR